MSKRNRHYKDVKNNFTLVEQRINDVHSETKGFMKLQDTIHQSVKSLFEMVNIQAALNI
jgi:hypothetical protein